MKLWACLHQALERQQGVALAEPGGPVLSGPQLLRLVRCSRCWYHCSANDQCAPAARQHPRLAAACRRSPLPAPTLQAGAAAALVQHALSEHPAASAGTADAPRVLAIYLTSSAAYVVAVLAALRLG